MLLGGLWQGVIFLHPLLGFDKPQGGPGGGDGGFGTAVWAAGMAAAGTAVWAAVGTVADKGGIPFGSLRLYPRLYRDFVLLYCENRTFYPSPFMLVNGSL